MKFFKPVILSLAMFGIMVACKNANAPEIKTVEVAETEKESPINASMTYAKVEFNIKGMTCAIGCAKSIEKKMAKLEGVKMAKVDFENELAMVEYDASKVTPQSLEETVGKVSEVYKVETMKNVEEFSNKK